MLTSASLISDPIYQKSRGCGLQNCHPFLGVATSDCQFSLGRVMCCYINSIQVSCLSLSFSLNVRSKCETDIPEFRNIWSSASRRRFAFRISGVFLLLSHCIVHSYSFAHFKGLLFLELRWRTCSIWFRGTLLLGRTQETKHERGLPINIQ